MSIYKLQTQFVWPIGSFESDSQIILVPAFGIPPELIVEHELVHVRLHQSSALGAVESVLNYLDVQCFLHGLSEMHEDVWRVTGSLKSLGSESVHESAAWFVTSVMLNSAEFSGVMLGVPSSYADLVGRIQALSTVAEGSDQLARKLCERAASEALSQPPISNLLSAQSLADLDDRINALEMDLTIRMFDLIDWASTLNQADAYRWLDGNLKSETETLVTRTAMKIDERALATRLARQMDLPTAAASRDISWNDDEQYDWFELMCKINPNIDIYAQVLVYEVGPNQRLGHTVESEYARRVIGDRIICHFSGASTHPYKDWIQTPPGAITFRWYDVKTLQLGYEALGWSSALSQLGDPDHFLTLVSLGGYDLATCDLRDPQQNQRQILRASPHVVICMTSFFNLWMAIARSGGVGGETQIEVHSIPATGLGEAYVYLFLRPSKREYPILLIIGLAQHWQRVLSLTPVFRGIAIIPVDEEVSWSDWIGDLRIQVIAAIGLIEKWWDFPYSKTSPETD